MQASHEGLALYSLIKNSNVEALELFLSKTKIDLNSPISSLQLLPIQVAFVLNSYNIIGVLIKHGANPNFESLDLISPMFQSDSVWSEEMFNALLDHGTSIRDIKFYGNLASHPIVMSIDMRHPVEITARLIANTIMSPDEWMKLLYYTLQKAQGIVSYVVHKIFSVPFTSPLDKRNQGLKLLKTLFTMLHNVTVETTIIHNILTQFDFIFSDPTLFTSFAAPHSSHTNLFTTLPNELVVSIFNRLSVPILLRLSRTCKALHYYTRAVTSFDTSFRSMYSSLPRKHLVHTNYDLKKAAQLLFLVNRFPNVTSAFLGSILVFPYAAQRIIEKWWANGMKSLTIRCLDRQKTLDLFNTAMVTGRLLERLDLNCFQRGHDVFVDTVRAFNHLPNLKYVSIVSRHYRPPVETVEVSLTHQSLLSLKLSGHHQYSSSKIILTLDTPQLEYLSLINTTQHVNIRHTSQLHTLKIVAGEHHQLNLNAFAHLTELKLVFPGVLALPQVKFNHLRRLGTPLSLLKVWAAIAPNLQELSLYYVNSLPSEADLSMFCPRVQTIDVHSEDTLQFVKQISVPTFKCTKFDFQYSTATNKFPQQMEHFWIRSSNIVSLPQTIIDKEGSLALSSTLKSLHIYKTSTMSRLYLKQVPYISLIANSGFEVLIDVTNVQYLELMDNSNKITLHGDFASLRHLILRRNTLVKINDERETLNKQALFTFDIDIV